MLRVKSICRQQGITLKELAERMAVSPEVVTRVLSDSGNPTLSTLINMAKALNVNVSELFEDFNADMLVRGYLEIGDQTHRINNFSDLQTIYNKLSARDGSGNL
ncbi:MAG TPA: helix-turn-helix transcriptional regulator [Prolixibacteraceae bacterium]|mgnify:FL=1|nr:helix-turn-helix transcriptional regulator [Prolixibacteraceae bacterium]HPB04945.1 helix-turn-helix transcriptional regulator [Prolixibacteraceae bacterium]HQN93008.1 helix-turn-helix transcriptional regulator [Prolixibacteraceae bacterium]HUM88429.1 helix-turn-helix transcriptional regulator [Prolixibacteraceae bacterium]